MYIFEDRTYKPIKPSADNDDFANHDRLVLRHHNHSEPTITIQLAGELTFGWIIGLLDNC